MDHPTMDIGQTKITTCVTECETAMIESQQVQNGRVEVMHVDRIFLHPVTDVIRLSVYDPRFHPPTSEPARKGGRVMVAALGPLAILCPRGPAKLSTENEQRLVQ